MTEERAGYTVSGLRIENELLRERVEELRKTVDGFSDASSFQWGEYQRRIKELEAQVARLEADNKRLRKLDSIPLDALRRYWEGTTYNSRAQELHGYTMDNFDTDSRLIYHWFKALDGDA